MKPDRDLRAAAIGLMATVATVGIVRGLMTRPAEATLVTPPGALVRPQNSSGDPAEPAGTMHLNTRGRAQPAPATPPAWPGNQPQHESSRKGPAPEPRA